MSTLDHFRCVESAPFRKLWNHTRQSTFNRWFEATEFVTLFVVFETMDSWSVHRFAQANLLIALLQCGGVGGAALRIHMNKVHSG